MPESSWKYEVPGVCKPLGAPHVQYTGAFVNSAVTTIVLPFDNTHVGNILRAAKDELIPKEFTWRGKPGIEAGNSRNQMACGSCFAFSTAAVLGSRFAIKYKLDKPPMPSPLWLLSNVNYTDVTLNQQACQGGIPQLLCKWIEANYCKSEKCWPYSLTATHGGDIPQPLNKLDDKCCFDCCTDPSAVDKFYIVKDSTKPLVAMNGDKVDPENTILAIQRDIMKQGPIIGAFDVYSDFMDYWRDGAPKKAVYARNANAVYNGGHAIVITGWGEKDGKRFWEFKNSWGNTGDEGYGYIAMYTSIDPSMNIGLDVPIYINGNWHGGTTTFEAYHPDLKEPGEAAKKKQMIPAEEEAGTILKYVGIALVFTIILIVVLYFALGYARPGDGVMAPVYKITSDNQFTPRATTAPNTAATTFNSQNFDIDDAINALRNKLMGK